MTEPLFAAPHSAVVRVALPLPVDSLFDYVAPGAFAPAARPGCRVLVPFRQRTLTGVVVECVDSAGVSGLRPLERVLDALPVLSPSMIAMLREAADEFLCPPGLALAAALPPGAAPRPRPGFALAPRGRAALESGAAQGNARAALALLARGSVAERALRAQGIDPALLLRLERDGLVVRARAGEARGVRPGVVRCAALAPGVALDAALAALSGAPRQAALLRRLAAEGEQPLVALAPAFDARLVRALVQRGFAAVHERAAPGDVFQEEAAPDAHLELTPDQAQALAPIVAAVRERRPETFLLHGVTGSGKTEVYLRAVGEALRAGRQALVLVPEITLTHQLVARLRARFGDALAVLHSALRPAQRLEQWQLLHAGEVAIAVGARSALFAPLDDLGVIVIDEEHDGAYKNEEGFRYHARRLAARRAQHARCPVVLGSATPSLETRYAAERGEVVRLTLPRRIGGRPLPAVQIVDLAQERAAAPRGRKLVLSRPLRRAMAEVLAEGGQTILLLNRRGFSTKVLCFDCGHAERCPHCDIALVYHAGAGALCCHYCDHRVAPPDACRGCGAKDTALLGLGTERLEEEVRAVFPEARIARLDRDAAARRGYAQRVLADLRARRLDVLVGTQMVAKGHDFPGVRLVGVVAADLGLHIPDFRAAERTFQLLTQVAGRAGRDGAPGRVVIQTFLPTHYAILPVREHDYETFYAAELAQRAALGLPPLRRLVQALCSSEDDEAARRAAVTLAQAADDAAKDAEDYTRMGPAPAPLARLRGRFRHQLLVAGGERTARLAGVALAAAARACERGVQASVDVDPQNML
jgi:primosomal protein N' (replication factor Y)